MNRKLQYWLLFGGTLLIYLNTLSYDYVLDDDLMIKNQFVQKGISGIPDILTNSYLKGFNGTEGQTYRPIPLISFAVEKAFFGLNSSISHGINLILYLLLGFLIFKFISEVWPKVHALFPFLVTALFLFHPVHTEVVANVKSRDEMLCALGGIIALWNVFRWTNTKEKKHYLGFLLGLILAVFSKETGFAYVITVPFFIWLFRERKEVVSTQIWIPLVIIIGGFFLIRSNLLETMTELDELNALNNALLLLDDPLDQKATAIFYTWIYVLKWIWPASLSWDYSTQALPLVEIESVAGILSILGWIAVLLFGFRAFVKKQTWVIGLVLFVFALLPTSNILLLFGATFGERFLFSPSIGIAILTGFGFVFIQHKLSDTLKSKFKYFVALLLILIASKSFIQKSSWESKQSIVLSGIENQPKSTRTWEAYASYCRDQSEKARSKEAFTRWVEKSMAAYEKSIELYPENYSALYNLGVLQMNNQQPELAKENFLKCVGVNPAFEDAWNNLGYMALNEVKLDTAKKYIDELLDLNPNHISGLINLGMYEYRIGNKDNSATAFEKVLSIDPQNEIAKKNLEILRKTE